MKENNLRINPKKRSKKKKIEPIVVEMPFIKDSDNLLSFREACNIIEKSDNIQETFDKLKKQNKVKNIYAVAKELKRRGHSIKE